ncbi:MAG: protoheme IX farnesyltransferase [Deltaproteobacteria bacterium]|nr:protoheme IX farnesyltransferase [Deltaproteobacteria bacterium]
MWIKKIKTYKELAKFEIVLLILICSLGGYLLGQNFEKNLQIARLMATLFGIFFLSTGASAFNQYQERNLDSKMHRTAHRPLVCKTVSPHMALGFSVFCICLGAFILAIIDLKICFLGLLALFFYNGLYTLWFKKNSAFAAVPGAIPGALPILMGYSSSNGQVFSLGGIYLFFLLFFWQMPHFWTLAIKYKTDYERGDIPTLPVVYGNKITQNHIVLWCLAYIGLSLGAPLFLKVGSLYLCVAFLMCFKIVYELNRFLKLSDDKRWLRFFLWVNFSLIIFIASAVADFWSVKLFRYWI